MSARSEAAGSSGARGLIIAISLLGFVGFFLWAHWAEVDQISRATGQVIPSGRVQVVQSADGGVITELLVREGDPVSQGQLLVKLDSTKARAALEESRAKEAALRAAMTRIEAELYDNPLEFDASVAAYPDFIHNQTSLYEKRRTALKEELDTLEQMLRLVKQELEMNQPLLATGDVSRTEVLRLQRQVAEISGKIVDRRNRYLQELQTELTKTEEELVATVQLRTQREDQLSRTELYAPTAGVVKNVRFTTVGAVLRPGDEVLQIVPTDDELIVEAKVAPADIGFIRPGQSASVKFDAYDYTIYGSGVGEVTYISADTLTEQTARGEISYYRVHVKVDASGMQKRRPSETIELQPGMTAMVEIKTGRNTIWRFLTKPLTKTISEAFTER
ncbi:MAG TPA: HlyD family efflux transporter periplasmic adaptor subunit [Steroidobacter sp.]